MTTSNLSAQETERRQEADTGQEGRMAGARQAAEDLSTNLAGAAGQAASQVGARLPEAAATTKAAMDEAARRMTTGSDQALTVGTAFSFGLTIGLLAGGANRILVTLAMIPAAAMGMTLLDRSAEGRGRRVAS